MKNARPTEVESSATGNGAPIFPEVSDENKQIATLKARAALAGHVVHELADGGFLAVSTRWAGMVRHCADAATGGVHCRAGGQAVIVMRQTFAAPCCAIIAPSHANGPVTEKHQPEAAATLADKQGFVTSDSLMGAGASGDRHAGFGRGGPTRKDGRTASDVFFTPRPPDALENADGGFVHVPEGIDMTRSASKGKSARTTQNTVTRHPALPFVADERGPRGGHIDRGYFDVQPAGATYGHGLAAGAEAFDQLMSALRDGTARDLAAPGFVAYRALIAAAALDKRGLSAGEAYAQSAAAHAFLELIAAAVDFAAARADWGPLAPPSLRAACSARRASIARRVRLWFSANSCWASAPALFSWCATTGR